MDSLTQIVLGAGVAELMMGRKIGNRAPLIGAIGGTIPDLDVIITSIYKDDPLSYLEIHRSYSHAGFTHLLLAFPLALITYRIFKRKYTYKEWYLVWFLCLFTHALLDCFTTYGTRLFLPFTNYLVGLNNISIIDPLYTLPFLLLLVVCLFFKRESRTRRKIAVSAMTFSLLYIASTFITKYIVHQKFNTAFANEHIQLNNLSTSPTILNNILWAGMGVNDSMIYCGEYSWLQKSDNIKLHAYPRNLQLEKGFESKELNTLKWFSQGLYFLQPQGPDTLKFFNVKWGRANFDETIAEKTFIFYFYLVKQNGKIMLRQVEPHFAEGEFNKALKQLWLRIKGENY